MARCSDLRADCGEQSVTSDHEDLPEVPQRGEELVSGSVVDAEDHDQGDHGDPEPLLSVFQLTPHR